MASSLTDIIRQQSEVTAFHEPLDCSFPEINYSHFNDGDTAQALIDVVIRPYLVSPCIVDTFADHSECRAWREQMDNTYPGFSKTYNQNKLRINQLSQVKETINLLAHNLYEGDNPQIQEKASGIVSLVPTSHVTYDSLSPLQKVELAKTIETKVYEFLTLFS